MLSVQACPGCPLEGERVTVAERSVVSAFNMVPALRDFENGGCAREQRLSPFLENVPGEFWSHRQWQPLRFAGHRQLLRSEMQARALDRGCWA